MKQPNNASHDRSVASVTAALARRALATFLLCCLAIAVASSFLITGGLADTASGIVLLVLIVMSFGLFALNPLLASADVRRAGLVLESVPGIQVVRYRGIAMPRLECVVPTTSGHGSSFKLQFAPGVAGDMFSESASFHLELPWGFPADVVAFRGIAYSDFPGVLSDMEEARRRLSASEYLWSDTSRGHLVSTIVPRWESWRKPDEEPQEVRERIVDRGRRMETIREKALGERRFVPQLIQKEGRRRGLASPFVLGGWCVGCHKDTSPWSAKSLQSCPECGEKPLEVLFRGNLKTKMDAVHMRGLYEVIRDT